MVRATARMKPAAPALAAEYTSRPDSPTRPASEMMVIRRPLLRSIMSGITAPGPVRTGMGAQIACIVHQHVDRAGQIAHLRDHGLDADVVRDVGLHGISLAS